MTPLDRCAPEGCVGAVWPCAGAAGPPMLRLARSAPIAIVSTSMPSAKPTSAMPIVGFVIDSGPSAIGLVPATAPGAEASSVKVNDWPAMLREAKVGKLSGSVVRKYCCEVSFRRISTVTVPGLNRSMVFLGSLSLKKKRYVTTFASSAIPEMSSGAPTRIGAPFVSTARSAMPVPVSLNSAVPSVIEALSIGKSLKLWKVMSM